VNKLAYKAGRRAALSYYGASETEPGAEWLAAALPGVSSVAESPLKTTQSRLNRPTSWGALSSTEGTGSTKWDAGIPVYGIPLRILRRMSESSGSSPLSLERNL